MAAYSDELPSLEAGIFLTDEEEKEQENEQSSTSERKQDDIMSPTSSSSNGSVGELCPIEAARAHADSASSLTLGLDFDLDAATISPMDAAPPSTASSYHQVRKASSSFSDLGDFEDFSLSESQGALTGSFETPKASTTPNATFYPIYEEDPFQLQQYALVSPHNDYSDARRSSNGDIRSELNRCSSKTGRSMSLGFAPKLRVVGSTDESQPLVGDIYPLSGESILLRADDASYIIFYKDDMESVPLTTSDDMYESSQEEEDVLGKPPRSYTSLGAAGHKVQTANCFTRDSTHPTRSLGRGLFRASTSVGNAFLKGAAGLVNQTYEGASGGVLGLAKGFGMGMLGLGTHTVRGAFRGVGQVTNLVGEMVLGAAPHFSIDGRLVLSNYRVIWVSSSAQDAIEVPIASILSIDSSTIAPHVATIECKTLLRVSIAFRDEVTCYSFLQYVWELYAGPKYLFAHLHYQSLLLKTNIDDALETPTYPFFHPEEDYKRTGVLDDSHFLRLVDNADYNLFPTYPSTFVVPSGLSDEELYQVSEYRSSRRIPAVVWRHPQSKALLARCAQPCAGLSGFVAEADQKLIRLLQQDARLHFFDARSQMAATANAAQGKGTEDVRNYDHTELHFGEIANIHAVRNAYTALSLVCQPGQVRFGELWGTQLRQTLWFLHVGRILTAADDVCRWLGNGEPVLVHCSDGWDRTPQLTTLVQLLLDPHYRTIEGLLLLIEKEWCSFGHLFRFRYAQGERPGQQELEEQSPVFIQWLDAVWQVWRQQPWAFEFSEVLLAALYEHVFSGRFGSFLYNCERERTQSEKASPTRSLWHELLLEKDKYVNAEYDGAKNFNSVGVALPYSVDEEDLVLWETHLVYADPVCRKYE